MIDVSSEYRSIRLTLRKEYVLALKIAKEHLKARNYNEVIERLLEETGYYRRAVEALRKNTDII